MVGRELKKAKKWLGGQVAAERVKGTFKGETFKPLPLDIAILKVLPEEGAKKGKYLWLAKGTKDILKELGAEGGLTSDMISGRLRLMRAHGHTVDVTLIGRGSSHRGWQRTETGKTMADRKV
jgi:hypothetical protein